MQKPVHKNSLCFMGKIILFRCQYALENKAGIPASDATGKFAQSRYTGMRPTPQGSLCKAGVPASDVLRVKCVSSDFTIQIHSFTIYSEFSNFRDPEILGINYFRSRNLEYGKMMLDLDCLSRSSLKSMEDNTKL